MIRDDLKLRGSSLLGVVSGGLHTLMLAMRREQIVRCLSINKVSSMVYRPSI